MLLYLNAATWTSGQMSERLANEVITAMDKKVHILLAHEMPGPGQSGRLACPFAHFFACSAGSTPIELLQRDVYSEIATPLKGGRLRETSMVLFHMALQNQEQVTDADLDDELN